MRLIRLAAWMWAVVILLVMWFPARQAAGITLTSAAVQSSVFAIGACLFSLAGRHQPPVLGSEQASYILYRFTGHVVRASLMLVAYAAILEIGQRLVPNRHPGVEKFAENTLSILLASAVVYALARLFIANRYMRRITERHLRRVAAALRSESNYSGELRDAVQAAYAISSDTSLSDAQKVERMRALLDEALSLDFPDHDEDVLNSAYGRRRAAPAPYRPFAEEVGANPPRESAPSHSASANQAAS
jgi:hypothetical protein